MNNEMHKMICSSKWSHKHNSSTNSAENDLHIMNVWDNMQITNAWNANTATDAFISSITISN